MSLAALSSPDEIIVIDDFLCNPESVRREALAATFRTYESRGFHYSEAKPSHLVAARGRERILDIIGQQYRSQYLESRYVAETGEQEDATKRSVWIHFDRCTWIGVLYLTLPQECEGGTTFFKHKPTGFTRWEEMLEATAGDASPWLPFCQSPDQWEEIHTVKMAFNRIVLFNSRQFHQATNYFGNTLDNCRLYQHFAFEQLDDAEILGRHLAP